jgi:hypothetical protein
MQHIQQFYTLLALGLLQLSAAGVADAQRAVSETRDVTIIELASRGMAKRAMVFRRVTGPDRDVIALTSDATAADLGGAMDVLRALHASDGDSVVRDIVAAVQVDRTTPRAGHRGKLDEAYLKQLQQEKRRNVAGFGEVKALRVKLPKRELHTR